MAGEVASALDQNELEERLAVLRRGFEEFRGRL
jgi:hypothetical protein